MGEFYPCEIKALPESELAAAAKTAVEINPSNALALELMAVALTPADQVVLPQMLTALTGKLWPSAGVELTVGFMESLSDELADRIVAHFNAWRTKGANVKFVRSTLGNAQVRVTRSGGGYWSYLGTDILHIARSQPTMSLQGFTMNTPESEYDRVVKHECGHTLGFAHEHMRRELVARLDVQKTIAYFLRTQGWHEATTRANVLTPLNEASIRGTPHADEDSIMCYQLPGSITIDGLPIRGGTDINMLDAQFASSLYPTVVEPPPPPPPPPKPEGESVLLKLIALIAAFRAKDWATVFKILGELFGGVAAGTITDAEMDQAQAALQAACPK